MTSNFLFFTTPLPHYMYKDVKLTRTLVSLIIVSIFAYYLQWFILIKWKNFLFHTILLFYWAIKTLTHF
ncbi:hypothetical protein OBCHQ24_07485 [Oceanobacillus iheyensis]|nr:hypothetical protein OBCHQ24_07485 [Oceanobacillus iheyensis]